MGLGMGIFLIVVGLMFVSDVIQYDIPGIDETTAGWILLAAGILSIVLGLAMSHRRSRTTHIEEHRVNDRI